MIVAALIATVTFAAGFTLPGGYRDKESIFQSICCVRYHSDDPLSRCCMVLFLMATAFHLGGKVHGRFFLCGYILIVFGMEAMVVAFMTGLYAVLPPSFGLPILTSCCAICCCSYFLAGYVVSKTG